MGLQRIVLIPGLVLAALFYAVAALIDRRKGMRAERWYLFIGLALLNLALFGYFGVLYTQWPLVIVPPLAGVVSIVYALWWRPRTD